MPAPNLSVIVKMSGGTLPPNTRAGDLEIYDNGKMFIFESDTDIVERQIDRSQVLDILQFARQNGFFDLPNIIHDSDSPSVPDVTISLLDNMGNATVTMTGYQKLRGEMRQSPFDKLYKKITDMAWQSYTAGPSPIPVPQPPPEIATPPIPPLPGPGPGQRTGTLPQMQMPPQQMAQQPAPPAMQQQMQPPAPVPAPPSMPSAPNLPFQTAPQPVPFELPSLDDILKQSNLDFGEKNFQQDNTKIPHLPPLNAAKMAPATEMQDLPPLGTQGVVMPPMPNLDFGGNQQNQEQTQGTKQQQPKAQAQQQPKQQAAAQGPQQGQKTAQPQAQQQPKQQPQPPKQQQQRQEQSQVPTQNQISPQQPKQKQPEQQKRTEQQQQQQRPPIQNAAKPQPERTRQQEREAPVPATMPPIPQGVVLDAAPAPERTTPPPAPRQEERSPREAAPVRESREEERQPERREQPRQQEQRQREEIRMPARPAVNNEKPIVKKPSVAWEATQELLNRLEESLHGKILTFYVADDHSISIEDMRFLYSHLRKLGRKKSLYVLPIIANGDVTVMWRMATLLREFCQDMSVIMPDASSVCTSLLSLSADVILMNPFGYISPIETKFNHPLLESGSEQVQYPLTEVLSAADAITIVGNKVKAKAETTDGNKTQDQIHPLVVTAARRQFALTKMLCANLLRLGSMKEKTDADIDKVVVQLTQTFPSSNYPIAFFEAKQMGLAVKETTEEVNDLLWELIRHYMHITKPVVSMRDSYRTFEQQSILIESVGRRTVFYKEHQLDTKNSQMIDQHDRWREVTMQLSMSPTGQESNHLQWKELELVGVSDEH